MKITNAQLKRIIKEELYAVLGEGGVAYSGVVLDEQSVQALKQAAETVGVPEGFVFNTKAGEPLPHHMTIVPFSPVVHPKGKHDFSADYPVGGEITLEVLSIGYNDKAMAAMVKPPAPISKKVKFPHVTIAIPEGGKPFNSNKIPKENFKGPILVKDKKTGEEIPLLIKGVVQEVPS
jgi:hypothetical protein